MFVFAGAFAAAASVWGQATAPDFISVDSQQVFTQTGDDTATPAGYSAGVSGPYAFVVSVEHNSADLSGNTAPTFTPAAGSSYAGSTTLTPNGTNWRASAYYATSGALTTDFNNGTYTVTQPDTPSNHTVSVDLSGDLYPAAPAVTITGGTGTWVGSTLQLTPGATLTLTTDAFANWETNGAVFNHIGLFLSHNGSDVFNLESFSDNADPYFSSGTGNPNYLAINNYTFTSGNYFVEIEFNAIAGVDTSGYPGVTAVALYTSRTTFSIEVIPEPAVSVEIAGLLALAGLMIHRRRTA